MTTVSGLNQSFIALESYRNLANSELNQANLNPQVLDQSLKQTSNHLKNKNQAVSQKQNPSSTLEVLQARIIEKKFSVSKKISEDEEEFAIGGQFSFLAVGHKKIAKASSVIQAYQTQNETSLINNQNRNPDFILKTTDNLKLEKALKMYGDSRSLGKITQEGLNIKI